ncbi:MAG: class I SAM-dependent methyltransferase [Bacilli bacterium]|nr:class I SAM-dependent methyltransferase [Bacilli bacterium]MDD4706024.1 class I SAM-dependent methyltransferase [Bacilli bacterium]
MVNKNKIKTAVEQQTRFYPTQAYNKTAILELVDYINEEYENVLDIGCGDGGLLSLLKQRYPNTIAWGLTISEDEALSVKSKGLNAIVGEATELQFNNKEFALVISRHMLEHSPYPEEIIKEMNRVLKDQGTAIICVPAVESELAFAWPDHFSVLKRETWIKMFTNNGFEIIKNDSGHWLASSSMKNEPEYRFVLKKIKTVSKKDITKFKSTVVYAKNEIALLVHNYILFDQMEQALKNIGIKYDIYVVNYKDELWENMSKDTYEYLKEKGYSPILLENHFNIKYKIVLEALDYNISIPSDYTIRFNYGLAKEFTNFSEWNIKYDYILCYGKYDSSILSTYAIPVEVGALKFLNFSKKKKRSKSSKIKVLYLPTYGKQSSIEDLHEELFSSSEEFDIVIKPHHGTTFLETKRMELLNKFTNVYDHKKSLKELLLQTDVVISDGSGAIFDAVYCDIPVIVYNKFDVSEVEKINSLEYKIIIEDKLPNFNNSEDLKQTILNALNNEKYISKRKNLKNELFIDKDLGFLHFKNIILKILKNDFSLEEKKQINNLKRLTRNYMKNINAKQQYHNNLLEQQNILLNDIINQNEFKEIINAKNIELINSKEIINAKNRELSSLEETLKNSNQKLNDIYNSTSWKITIPIRKLKMMFKKIF